MVKNYPVLVFLASLYFHHLYHTYIPHINLITNNI